MLKRLMIMCIMGCAFIGIFSLNAQETPTFFIGVFDHPNGALTNGARLAVEEINRSGGVRGLDGVFYRLELINTVVNSDEELQQAVDELRASGVIAVLGPITSEDTLAAVSNLQSLNAPVLTPATDDTLLISDTTGQIFRTRASAITLNNALADFIINDFNLQEIITVQLDLESTANLVSFNTAAQSFGVTPGTALLTDPSDVDVLAERLLATDPSVLVVFGNPSLAGALYSDLRADGWQGLFTYNQATDTRFRNVVQPEQLEGILSATSWSLSINTVQSIRFLNDYIRTFGTIPGEIEASAYDSVMLIAQGLQEAGDLRANLRALDEIAGVQGVLRPATLNNGEISDNVTLTRISRFGGAEIIARYAQGVKLPPDPLPIDPEETPTIPATATPDGVYITITGAQQNVRSGSSINYPVLGQLVEGDTAQVIGASADNAWVIIDYRGQQGWLATYLLEVTGDLNTVPILTPPPTPTAVVTPTPIPPPEADIIIDGALTVPSPIVPGLLFNVSVTVRNAGNSPAGSFIIAGTFPPSNNVLQTVVPGLAPGQSVIVQLSGTMNNTGYYTTNLIADANNQVPEGIAGETNNGYVLSYVIDRAVIRQAGQTLNIGDTIDLEGNAVQGDANWNNTSGIRLEAINGSNVGIIPAVDLTTIHYDLINPSSINRPEIPRSEIATGTLIGIITADGNRGVMRVDAVSDSQLVVTFKVYSN